MHLRIHKYIYYKYYYISHSGCMACFYQNLEQFKPYEIEAAKRILILNNTEIKKWCNNNKYNFKI